jgi:hypothetical protein
MHLTEYGMNSEQRNNTPLPYIHETDLGLTSVFDLALSKIYY